MLNDFTQRLYNSAEDLLGTFEEPYRLLLTDFDKETHPNIEGPLAIENHAIVYIAYTEDKEANDLYKKIGRKWEEIGSLTNVKDDGELIGS